MFHMCPLLFQGQSLYRHSVLLPFVTLTRKSLIVWYVHRAALWRKSDQLFVCYGPYEKGLPENKGLPGLPSPLGVRAHSTRDRVASKSFSSSVFMHNICNAAGWTTPLTFVRFYSFDLCSVSEWIRQFKIQSDQLKQPKANKKAQDNKQRHKSEISLTNQLFHRTACIDNPNSEMSLSNLGQITKIDCQRDAQHDHHM